VKKAKAIALDPGSKLIGVAISDPDCIIAFARPPIKYSETAAKEIINLCIQENVSTIVVGKLFHEGQYAINPKLIADLKAITDIEIVEFDEDYSTQQAIEQLKESGADQSDIKEMKDSFAARIILDRYITS
jgi:RNase H-fold protein (predicted Holliday junction resolvase)